MIDIETPIADDHGSGKAELRADHSHPWGAVALLMLIGILNYLDRALPAILAEPIRHDLALSDTTLGLINGLGFALVYALAGIPIASLADRGRYGVVISLSVGFWSVMTGLGCLVGNGWQLGLSRMGVALGEAGSTPAAHALISRRFPIHRRALALSVLTLSIPLGSMAGFVIGGLLGAALGWRGTFAVMGVVGMISAPLVYLALGRDREPRSATVANRASMKQTSGNLAALFQKRSFNLILAGAALVAAGGYASTAFGPAMLMRTHGMTVAQAGIQLGAASGILGVAAVLCVGWAADHFSKRDKRWSLGVVIVAMLVGLPFSILAFVGENRTIVVLCLAVNNVSLVLSGCNPPFPLRNCLRREIWLGRVTLPSQLVFRISRVLPNHIGGACPDQAGVRPLCSRLRNPHRLPDNTGWSDWCRTARG
jgi:predicted MFS family arabinose efflux permease